MPIPIGRAEVAGRAFLRMPPPLTGRLLEPKGLFQAAGVAALGR